MAKEILEFRAMFVIFTDPCKKEPPTTPTRYEGYFWDKDLWDKNLSQWSQEGYNAVVWLGSNEFVSSWPEAHGWPGFKGGHRLIRLEEFPEARSITSEENEEIIEQMKWLLRRAKKLGMKNLLYTTSIHYPEAFAKAHGLFPTGVRNELTRAYTEALFAEFPRVYEDLDGFYSCMAEAIPGDKSSFFKEAFVPGLKRSGRKPLLIAGNWMVPMDGYAKNVAPKEIYDNTWLGFHGYNQETFTDAKPYPAVVEYSEKVGLPTIVDIYPAYIYELPFNSAKFAYEIAQEMKKVENFIGFTYFEHSGRKLSPLFRKALAYYAKNPEPYSDEPWVALLEEQFGDRKAAKHFLNAYNVSGRIIPETSALVYSPHDNVMRFEISMPYKYLTGDFIWQWKTSPARGRALIPVWHYAKFIARDQPYPKGVSAKYGDNDGIDPNRYPYYQFGIWGSGGAWYDIIPPVHMRKVRSMGEECLREAEEAMKTVKKNLEEAQHAYNFMKAYKLLSHYYERKVSAGISAMVYAHSQKKEERDKAEKLADEALESYLEAANFMQENLTKVLLELYGETVEEVLTQDEFGNKTIPELIEAEKKDREELAAIFKWPGEVKPLENIQGLYLKCKTCQVEFATGFNLDKETFEKVFLIDVAAQVLGVTCPKGHKHLYEKKDYFFKAR